LSNGHIAEILENAKKALQAHIRAHTGGVWRELQGKTGIGSATCIRIADRLFLATAAHNFDVLLHGGKVTFFSSSMRSTTNLKDIARNYSEYGKDGTLDCAWIEIEPDSAARAKVEGLPLKYVDARHQMDLEASDTSDYNVVGMPWEMHKFYDEGGTRHYEIPVIVYNTRPHNDAKPEDDNLLLEYEEHAILEGEAVKLPHPSGVSGGGGLVYSRCYAKGHLDASQQPTMRHQYPLRRSHAQADITSDASLAQSRFARQSRTER